MTDDSPNFSVLIIDDETFYSENLSDTLRHDFKNDRSWNADIRCIKDIIEVQGFLEREEDFDPIIVVSDIDFENVQGGVTDGLEKLPLCLAVCRNLLGRPRSDAVVYLITGKEVGFSTEELPEMARNSGVHGFFQKRDVDHGALYNALLLFLDEHLVEALPPRNDGAGGDT